MEKEVLLEGKTVVHRRKQSREREENTVSIVLLVSRGINFCEMIAKMEALNCLIYSLH